MNAASVLKRDCSLQTEHKSPRQELQSAYCIEKNRNIWPRHANKFTYHLHRARHHARTTHTYGSEQKDILQFPNLFYHNKTGARAWWEDNVRCFTLEEPIFNIIIGHNFFSQQNHIRPQFLPIANCTARNAFRTVWRYLQECVFIIKIGTKFKNAFSQQPNAVSTSQAIFFHQPLLYTAKAWNPGSCQWICSACFPPFAAAGLISAWHCWLSCPLDNVQRLIEDVQWK